MLSFFDNKFLTSCLLSVIKEKEVRQSLKDELAKMNEKDGSSLVLSMNESISQLKAEVARARAEVLEAGGDAPKSTFKIFRTFL